jgi:hypothetical protein
MESVPIMPIELNCPGCSRQLRLADEHAGKTGQCPECETLFTIPRQGTVDQAAPVVRHEQPSSRELPNPYSSPQTSSLPSSTTNNTPTILGWISIGSGLLSFCCCLGMIVSLPIGIAGLVLTFNLPAEERQQPLLLNIIGIVIPFLWILVWVFWSFAIRPQPVFPPGFQP